MAITYRYALCSNSGGGLTVKQLGSSSVDIVAAPNTKPFSGTGRFSFSGARCVSITLGPKLGPSAHDLECVFAGYRLLIKAFHEASKG